MVTENDRNNCEEINLRNLIKKRAAQISQVCLKYDLEGVE